MRPWYPLAYAADGRALISAAAAGGTLVIVSAAPADDLITPVLLRSIANSIAPEADSSAALEIVPIADSALRAWTRAPGPVIDPRIDTVERDDRRWLWLAALVLLGVETWLRHGRREDIAVAEEASRVA